MNGFGDKRFPVSRPRFTNKIVLFLVASAIALLATYLFWSFAGEVKALARAPDGRESLAFSRTRLSVQSSCFLVGIVGYLFVRALNSLFFGTRFPVKTDRCAHAHSQHLHDRCIHDPVSDRVHVSCFRKSTSARSSRPRRSSASSSDLHCRTRSETSSPEFLCRQTGRFK